DIFFWLPDVFTSAAKTKGLETHGFESHVAGEDQQIRPGYLVAIFLFDGPEQAARFVQIAIVRPAIDGCKALTASASSPTTIGGAIGASTVPGQADKQAAVMSIVGRPPVLTVGHQCGKVRFQSGIIQALESLRIIKIRTQWIGGRSML